MLYECYKEEVFMNYFSVLEFLISFLGSAYILLVLFGAVYDLIYSRVQRRKS